MRVAEVEEMGASERRVVALMRATALLWLDLRDIALCHLSAESGEWPERVYSKEGKRMDWLMKSLREDASSIIDEHETDALIWAVLSEQASLYGYTVLVNWSLNIKDDGAEAYSALKNLSEAVGGCIDPNCACPFAVATRVLAKAARNR